ncbi:MAG: alkaline phosphatase D family protein [Bacteroidota bacterium]
MKQTLFILAFTLLYFQTAVAQNLRAMPDSTLAPFYHGVASGDPLIDRVILWTRVTLDIPADSLQLNWKIATDTLFNNIVSSGTAKTGAWRDYTVKVDAGGLQSGTWYYYQFEYQGHKSIVGRTKTLPQGNLDQLRMGVVSCADYQNGYYHAYRDLALRNTVDVVLHLGDFIYEYGAASTLPDRNHEPAYEVVHLDDYRLRYAFYKLDPDLRLLQQQLPMIAVWDDHETANNAWTDGAENHTPATEGPWIDRKNAGKKAYFEWMPIRENMVASNEVYRKFEFGNLATLFMLDTRLEGRQMQVAATDSLLNDTNRTIMSTQQFDWLKNGLLQSQTRWNIIGQQVMMAPLTVFGSILNTDQWDGYPAQRKKLYDVFLHDSLDNVVVLAGDIHTAWANDLPLSDYVAASGANSAAVEFVAPSVTSANVPLPFGPDFVKGLNPHVKFVELVEHGYYILNITPARTQADYVFVSDIKQKPYTSNITASWVTEHGSRHLSPGTVTTGGVYPPLAPFKNETTGINTPADEMIDLSFSPNPFLNRIALQFNMLNAGSVQLTLRNQLGQVVWTENVADLPAGLNCLEFDGSRLASGVYVMQVQGKTGKGAGRILKISK